MKTPIPHSTPDSLQEQESDFDHHLDRYLPKEFRKFIETSFYQKVSEQGTLEHMKNDPEFFKNPSKHIALFTDHGVVHVRDVAKQVLVVLDRANGVLIPKRASNDLEFMKGYSVLLAYMHDIGMSDFTQSGRFMHPEFAAQFVFSDDFAPMVSLLWSKNAGNIPWTLSCLYEKTHNADQLKMIFREIIALSVGHSKSKLPIDVLNDRQQLRAHIVSILSKPLKLLFLEQKIMRLEKSDLTNAENLTNLQTFQEQHSNYLKAHSPINEKITKQYHDYEENAFSWLTSTDKGIMRFILNVTDSIRCIRAADALRQRGTVLRTSAGYEIFVDRKTANAIYALRNKKTGRLYMLESKKSVNAGEANLASSELDGCGHLRLSFHLGAFITKKVTKKAARHAAFTIDDIQADTIQSFKRNAELDKDIFPPPNLTFDAIKILVETTDDNPDFAHMVCKYFAERNKDECYRIQPSFSLHGLDDLEVQRYLGGQTLSNYLVQRNSKKSFFDHLKQAGYAFNDDHSLFENSDERIISLTAGEQLIRSGSKSGFVYFPMDTGLRVYPMGGYESSLAPAWVPLGNTGVIRGSVRNADIFSEKPLNLICIPKDIYLKHWYHPISAKELHKMWNSEHKSQAQQSPIEPL